MKAQLITLEGEDYPSLGIATEAVSGIVTAIIGVVTAATTLIITLATQQKAKRDAAVAQAAATGLKVREMYVQSVNMALSEALNASIIAKENAKIDIDAKKTNNNLLLIGGCLAGAMLLKPKEKKRAKK